MPGLLIKCALLTAATVAVIPPVVAPEAFSFEDPKKRVARDRP